MRTIKFKMVLKMGAGKRFQIRKVGLNQNYVMRKGVWTKK